MARGWQPNNFVHLRVFGLREPCKPVGPMEPAT
jgi:hypothetical protein